MTAIWTPPRTWLAGEKDTAALRNTQIRDNLETLSTFVAYTPVLKSSGTAVTVSAASGGYMLAGKIVTGWFEFTINAPGTGSYTVTLPPAPTAAHWFPKPLGAVTCINGVGGFFSRQAIHIGSTTEAAMTGDGGTRVSQTSPFTFASGHQICGTWFYEAA